MSQEAGTPDTVASFAPLADNDYSSQLPEGVDVQLTYYLAHQDYDEQVIYLNN